MYENHTEDVLIAELSDSELIDIIRTMSPRMGQAVKMINNQGQPVKPSVIGLLNKNYNPEKVRERAEKCFKFLDQSYCHYVMEAVLRGIEVSGFVQTAYGRSEALPSNDMKFLLSVE